MLCFFLLQISVAGIAYGGVGERLGNAAIGNSLDANNGGIGYQRWNVIDLAGVGMGRVAPKISDYYPNGYNSSIVASVMDGYVRECYRRDITPVFLGNINDSGPSVGYGKWKTFGQTVASRYRPGSNWNINNGHGKDWGIRYYMAVNEPRSSWIPDNFTPQQYKVAVEGFADGVRAADSTLLVGPGGFTEISLRYNNNEFIPTLTPLFQDGTLDFVMIHRYWGGVPIDDYTWSLQNQFEQIKDQYNIPESVKFATDEFNTRGNDANGNLAQERIAKDYLTAAWDALGVIDDAGQPCSEFVLTYNVGMLQSEERDHGLWLNYNPITFNRRGKVFQMLAHLTKGLEFIYNDPKGTGQYRLTGNGKTMWVWQNRVGWSSLSPSTSYQIKNIPAGTTEIKVYRYNSWKQSGGSAGSEVPFKTISISGQKTRTIGGLPNNETLMFIGNAVTPGYTTPINRRITLRAKGNNKFVAADRNLNGSNTWKLAANRSSAGGSWEKFDVFEGPNGTVSLKSRGSGKYVSTRGSGAGATQANPLLRAVANSPSSDWELFKWVNNSDGTVSLRCVANNKFVSSDRNLDGVNWPLSANRNRIGGSWEKFTWNNIGSAGQP
ncbi:MAG: hypothetical protein AAGG38_00205 [Planctomycetota bacterium]